MIVRGSAKADKWWNTGNFVWWWNINTWYNNAEYTTLSICQDLQNYQVSSVTQSCPTLYDPMDCSMPGFPVITNSWSLLKFMSIELVMPSNHLILCHPLFLLPTIFPSIRVFSNESVLRISGQNIGVSASTSVIPMSIQDWCPLGLTSYISLQSMWLSIAFSNTTVQKHQFFGR